MDGVPGIRGVFLRVPVGNQIRVLCGAAKVLPRKPTARTRSEFQTSCIDVPVRVAKSLNFTLGQGACVEARVRIGITVSNPIRLRRTQGNLELPGR